MYTRIGLEERKEVRAFGRSQRRTYTAVLRFAVHAIKK
jgi:hypothetical protein